MFLKKMGIKDIYISFVHSNRTELWPKRYSDYMLTDYKTIEGIAREEYFSNIERHPCWYGKLAITHDGYILPCIMAKRFIIGTIKRISLKDVMLNKMTKDYWTLTKDKINICKECEYRYSCHDCRPIQSQDGSLFGCNRFCQIPRMERGWLT
jgi:radical SAM protein with 4Fe4S-binding SPASM domain